MANPEWRLMDSDLDDARTCAAEDVRYHQDMTQEKLGDLVREIDRLRTRERGILAERDSWKDTADKATLRTLEVMDDRDDAVGEANRQKAHALQCQQLRDDAVAEVNRLRQVEADEIKQLRDQLQQRETTRRYSNRIGAPNPPPQDPKFSVGDLTVTLRLAEVPEVLATIDDLRTRLDNALKAYQSEQQLRDQDVARLTRERDHNESQYNLAVADMAARETRERNLVHEIGKEKERADFWQAEFNRHKETNQQVAGQLLQRVAALASPPPIQLDKDQSVQVLADKAKRDQDTIAELRRQLATWSQRPNSGGA